MKSKYELQIENLQYFKFMSMLYVTLIKTNYIIHVFLL